MAALVIKEWTASNQAVDSEGNYVRIRGRAGGCISWFLALLKVDPTTSIKVSERRVEFSSASLSGTEHRMIPVANICSTYYGYHKPWKAVLLLFLVLAYLLNMLGFIVSGGEPGLSWVVFAVPAAALIALLYYHLGRTLTLGFVEHSGVISAIRFKRSVIEGLDINESQARYICVVSQYLIEAAGKQVEAAACS